MKRLLRIANFNKRGKEMFRKVSIILVLIVLMIILLLLGGHTGFDQGYNEAMRNHAIVSFSGGTAYGSLGQWYSQVMFLLFVFLIGKLIKKELLSQIICISSLIWTLYIFWWIYLQKSIYFDRVDDTFSRLLRDSMPLDWFCFFAVLGLIGIQIITAFQHYFEWKRNNAEVK